MVIFVNEHRGWQRFSPGRFFYWNGADNHQP